MGIIWTALGLVLVGAGLGAMWSGITGGGWQKIPCIIERFEIAAKPDTDAHFVPDLAFRYEFAGRSYTSHRLWRGKQTKASYGSLSEIRHTFASNTNSECHVNPRKPEQACLVKEDPRNIWGGLAFAVFACFFTAIGLAMIFEKPSLVRLRNRGFAKGVIPVIFVQMFGTAGLGLLVMAIVGRESLPLLLALPCLAFGMGGSWALLKRHRRRLRRALKDHQRNLRRARS
ncbi:DUF3592 domain-containing protein [Luteolibacter sp. GHJ8]|uniref:DUF3592 domain-containing protein n=1 Tax=Luteolibacter rhizosphaerae TaxID=2989719 RepID=A0ABT3FY91_9BACT|nr:DUF3592 domain-containing protein [Luteolibacter rhizosphaerae]MCW1912537.1 DUF3592 domain-containing protein [Luteolibacter rhizosphaerae]